MVGDLLMFNDHDKVFTFVQFECLVRPSGEVTFRFKAVEPYAQGVYGGNIDRRLWLITLLVGLIVIYTARETYSHIKLQIEYRRELSTQMEEDHKKNQPGSRKLRVLEEQYDESIIDKQLFYTNF